MRQYPAIASIIALTVAMTASPIYAKSMSDTAFTLAETGAEGLTWMLIVAGVIVVLGIVLFVVSRRNRNDGAIDDGDDSTIDESDATDETPDNESAATDTDPRI